MKTFAYRDAHRGFSRTDLLAVLTMLTLLALVTRPVWANGEGVRSLVCRDNLRRLAAGWLMFADDNEGRLVINAGSPLLGMGGWANGQLSWHTDRDNTNTVYLTDFQYAGLWPYLAADASVYKCPADDYVSAAQARLGWSARVRSYAMNCFMGDGDRAASFQPLLPQNYAFFKRMGDFRRLPPSSLFVFVEEHPDSINDPILISPNFNTGRWLDFPGPLHQGTSGFAFADGHVEPHPWVNLPIHWPPHFGQFVRNITTPLDDPDLLWMRAHTSEPLSPGQ